MGFRRAYSAIERIALTAGVGAEKKMQEPAECIGGDVGCPHSAQLASVTGVGANKQTPRAYCDILHAKMCEEPMTGSE